MAIGKALRALLAKGRTIMSTMRSDEWKALHEQQAQAQLARQQQTNKYQQQLALQNTPNAWTTTTTGTTLGSISSLMPSQMYGPYGLGHLAGQPAGIDTLTPLEAGWQYVRWRGKTKEEVEAYVVPIVALATRGGRVDYVLGDATPSVEAHGVAWFLGVLAPTQPYDATEWHEKAQRAYYEWHAAQVAAKLTKGANPAAAQSSSQAYGVIGA